MIRYIVESASIWIVLYAFYQLFLQKETFFRINRIYLLVSLVAGLILPLFSIPLTIGSDLISYEIPLNELIIVENQLSSLDSSGPTNHTNWLAMIIFAAYWIGLLYILFRFGQNLKSIFSIYQKGVKFKNGIYTEVNMSDDWNPFSFFRWMFIPEAIRSSNEYAVIKEHELAHIRQWHSLDILFLEILRAVFWFNPIVKLYKKALVQNHEYLADQNSLEHTQKYNYGKLLLSFNTVHPDKFLGNRLNNSIIKNRITMMYKNRSNRNNQWKYLLVLPLFSLIFLVFSCEQKEAVQDDTTDTEQIQENPTKTTDEVFKVVEQMPRFPGCENVEGTEEEINKCSSNKLMTYIFENLKYPEAAREKGVEGTVIAEFVVNTTGSVQDAKIVRDIGEGCGDAVLKLINSMNDLESKWVPGKQRGENVKVMYTLPVKFKLEDKK